MRLTPNTHTRGAQRRHPLRLMPATMLRRVAALAFVVALGLGLGFAFGLSRDDGASAGRDPLPQTGGHLVVFTEFAPSGDSIWAADPDDPSQRALLGHVAHAANYGISAALSPDGARIAYTVLPPGIAGPAPDAPAQLWVLDAESGLAALLAEDVDLPVEPVWSPAGDAVVVRASTWDEEEGGRFALLRIGLDGARTTLVTSSAGLLPVDFSARGDALYFAALSDTGTDLGSVALTGEPPETVAHLSDGFARDWSLSPDGTRIAYLARDGDDADAPYQAHVLDIATGSIDTPLAGRRSDQYHPVWDGAGGLTVGASGGPTMHVAGGAVAPLAGPGGGIDVPMSWSPDAAHLALRAFAGTSASDPGPSWVYVSRPDGSRERLSEVSDVTVLGWLEAPR